MSEAIYDRTVPVKRVMAKVREWHQAGLIDFAHAEVLVKEDQKLDALAVNLRVKLLETRYFSHAETVRRESFPLSGWQIFKERRFPKWALKRWPVQYRTFVVESVTNIWHTCPHLHIPDQKAHVEFLTMDALPGAYPGNWKG